ncbi:type II 3-dehydroquinate dehydratase [Kribbia dieselivorans]|uniref:type II 3-dehydroquinate dehydratase n=1 Tax=Kribbia dieselivorans TaxID=331526 RepID=UPI000AB57CBF|nr:type II 3-dehydroquinate dehydratase [Kribbia dieselivorans]
MEPPVISVINGPNLNLLGQREPEIYGSDTLADVESRCAAAAGALGFAVACFQSNHEGAIIDEIHRLRATAAGFVVNLGAYTHTSVAIRDALATVAGPIVEVHISNVHARESFRHHSYVSDLASGVIVGCGVQGYDFAVARIAELARA